MSERSRHPHIEQEAAVEGCSHGDGAEY